MLDITIAVIVWALYWMTAPAIHRWAGRPTKPRLPVARPAFPGTAHLTCQHRYRELCTVERPDGGTVWWLVCRGCGIIDAAHAPPDDRPAPDTIDNETPARNRGGSMDCATCDRPVVDAGVICHPCTDHLRDRLAEIAETADELDPVLSRQTRHGTGTGRPSAESPLPVHLGALETARDIRHALTSWALLIMEERSSALPTSEVPPIGPRCFDEIGCRHRSCAAILREAVPDDSSPAVARFLAANLPWLRHRDYAPDVWGELHGLAARLHRTVDSPAELTYLGPCAAEGTCEQDLRAPVGAASVTCPACGTRHDVNERRAANIATCRDLLVSRLMIVDLLDRWGYPVPVETVDTWISRRRLPRRGDRYRVGDALDLAVGWAARARKTVKAA